MADVCPSYDDRLTAATPCRPARSAAAGAQVTAARSTTASVGGCCVGAGISVEI